MILSYHSIDANGLLSTTPPEEFERQMRYIKEKKYKVVPLSRMCLMLERGEDSKGCIALTFDNGYFDFFKNAFPVLKRYNFPATVFLVTGTLGQGVHPTKSKVALAVMSEGDIRRASTANSLIEFMPQSKTSVDLSKLPFAEAVKEINGSRVALESLTNKPADILGYPKGRYTPEIVEYVRTGGQWLGAVTKEARYIQRGDDPFKLPRIQIDSSVTFAAFKKMVR
ncbi:MAG: hypothetical protein JWN50_433 [Parcubacteria group bacterium]|nr:hypothetical protein [Parcubacteria group bacterium]